MASESSIPVPLSCHPPPEAEAASQVRSPLVLALQELMLSRPPRQPRVGAACRVVCRGPWGATGTPADPQAWLDRASRNVGGSVEHFEAELGQSAADQEPVFAGKLVLCDQRQRWPRLQSLVLELGPFCRGSRALGAPQAHLCLSLAGLRSLRLACHRSRAQRLHIGQLHAPLLECLDLRDIEISDLLADDPPAGAWLWPHLRTLNIEPRSSHAIGPLLVRALTLPRLRVLQVNAACDADPLDSGLWRGAARASTDTAPPLLPLDSLSSATLEHLRLPAVRYPGGSVRLSGLARLKALAMYLGSWRTDLYSPSPMLERLELRLADLHTQELRLVLPEARSLALVLGFDSTWCQSVRLVLDTPRLETLSILPDDEAPFARLSQRSPAGLPGWLPIPLDGDPYHALGLPRPEERFTAGHHARRITVVPVATQDSLMVQFGSDGSYERLVRPACQAEDAAPLGAAKASEPTPT